MTLIIAFGKYDSDLEHMNAEYNNICDKIEKFAIEGGIDPCNRKFDAEEIISFAIKSHITSKSMDYIYRHYVYHKISKIEKIDIDTLELHDVMSEFINIS